MKKKQAPPPLNEADAVRRYAGQTVFGAAANLLWTGKIQKESCISYSLSLLRVPAPDYPAAERALCAAAASFYAFLEKESEKKRDEVWFGGLLCRLEGQTLILSSAFSPFSERVWKDRARLTLSPRGAIEKAELI